MKKTLSIFLFLLLTQIKAQKINSISLYQGHNDYIISLDIDDTSLVLGSDGTIISLSENGGSRKAPLSQTDMSSFTVSGNGDFDYDESGRVISRNHFSDNKITYYDNFYDYNSGKLKSVKGVSFEYYDSFYPYLKGKIKSFGNLKFDYYDNFYEYLTGKIKSINGLKFEYYDNFYKYKTGKLKSVKGNDHNIIITLLND